MTSDFGNRPGPASPDVSPPRREPAPKGIDGALSEKRRRDSQRRRERAPATTIRRKT